MITPRDVCWFCDNKVNPFENYCSEDCEEKHLIKQDEADEKGLCIWCFINKQFGKLTSCEDCWKELEIYASIVDYQLDKWRLESDDR